ncbi:uncharacterized protein M6B38_344725 [Iris pallida]|uniref:Zinc finger PHD-type domain-containing protein n=1 Tax=Iris pallida TaxID=29817 RepID=A0AAX6GTV5_IRIPA|nr:uncharacterized protein M6B38_344725 [Iris pallida]
MRSRSHRLPPSDPPDDWGDGSWTVDCSCGVTFDDGEEMVSCDECGVWVHTRCSRFIRGETSFACHNCSKAPNPSLAEETEVAQLLVELPTCPPPPPPALPPPHPPAAPTHRPPFRLWAEVPLEDRVHVQGLPGGDPALFRGIAPSVFTTELWKRAGYVPKKFNFQYREFSCWDEDGGGENPASRGANVLFSLSKEVVPLPVPVPVLPRGMERRLEERKVQHHQLQGWGKKERNRLRAIAPHSSSKRRREESTTGKKKVRGDGDLKTRRDSPAAANENRVGLDESIAEVQNKDNSSVANGEGIESGGSAEEGLKQNASLETLVKVAKEDENNGYFLKVNDSNVTQEGNSALVNESIKEEDVNKAAYGLRQPKDESHYEGDLNEGSCHVVIDEEEPRAVIDYPSVPDMHDLPDADGRMSLSSKLQEVEVKICMADAQGFENIKLLACPASDGIPRSANQLPHRHQKPSSHSSEILLEHQTVASLSSNGHKSREDEKEVVFSNQVYDKTTEGKETGVSERKQHGQVVEESPSSATVEESSFEATHASKIVGDPTKCEDSNLQEVPPSLHKPVVTADKSSSTSLAPVISRPSVSGSYKALVSTASSIDGKAKQLSKQRMKVTSLTSGKKDIAATVSSTEESMREVSKHPVKGHSKGLEYHGPKSSQSSRITHSSDSKYVISDSKEPLLGPSSKYSTAINITTVAVSVEAVGSSPTQNASIQLSSGSCQKSEKLSQPLPHPQLNCLIIQVPSIHHHVQLQPH